MKIVLLFVGLFSYAIANPISVGLFSNPTIELYALFSESVVMALMLRYEGFLSIRIFFTWMLVTSLTYIFFMGVVLLTLLYFLHEIITSQIVFFLIFLCLEFLIVMTEAKVMQKMSQYKLLNPKQIQLKMKKALLISFIGNTVSIFMGFIPALKEIYISY